MERHTLCDWQELRIVRYETATIEQQLRELDARVEQARALAVAHAMRHEGEARYEALRETSCGVAYLVTVLEDLCWPVQQAQVVTEKVRKELVELLGEPAPLVRGLSALVPEAETAEADAAEASRIAIMVSWFSVKMTAVGVALWRPGASSIAARLRAWAW